MLLLLLLDLSGISVSQWTCWARSLSNSGGTSTDHWAATHRLGVAHLQQLLAQDCLGIAVRLLFPATLHANVRALVVRICGRAT